MRSEPFGDEQTHAPVPWSRWAAAALVAGLAACSSLQGGAGPPSPGAAPPLVWEYPASEFPTMCLVMKADGSAQFVGGFLYFNPSNWRVDPASGRTILTIGGGALPLPETASTGAAVARSDSSRRTVEYRIDPQTRSIDFGGFSFFRRDRCSLL